MKHMCCLTIATVLTGVFVVSAHEQPQQNAAFAVKIVAPSSGALLAGSQLIKAAIFPEGTPVTSVEFFVDGAPACTASSVPFECLYQFGETIQSHAIRAVANFASGERVVATVRTTGHVTDSVAVTAVSVPVVVTDYLGRFVKGLNRDSFRVFENGEPQEITFVNAENIPLDVVLGIDISGSMQPSMPKLKTSVSKFLDVLTQLDSAKAHVSTTLLAFNDRNFVIATPGDAPSKRALAIESLKAFGGTSLFDALLSSFDLFGKEISRKAIIVFTDGDDRSSLASIEPVESRLRESEASVYMITQGATAKMAATRRIVNHISEISGGRSFFIENIDELQDALRLVVDDVTHQYLIGYSPTNTAHDGSYRTITVKATVKSHQIRARDGYRAPVM